MLLLLRIAAWLSLLAFLLALFGLLCP